MRKIALVLSWAFLVEPAIAGLDDGVVPYEDIQQAAVVPIRPTCQTYLECKNAHAVIFIHGIYGDETTFSSVPISANPRFAGVPRINWPELIPPVISGKQVDVFVVKYETQLVAWLKKNISTLDEVVYGVFKGIDNNVLNKSYSSIGIIGHSLGGNVATSYLHTVKTERGHDERARHSFIITLGTPTDGADIAAVGLLAKGILLMHHPLLTSLQTDNTFLRMLAYWRYSENGKASRFGCRPVHFYAGLEGTQTDGVQVVSKELAEFMRRGNMYAEYKTFPNLNHFELAKPPKNQDVQDWVSGILQKEIDRVELWNHNNGNAEKLCTKLY